MGTLREPAVAGRFYSGNSERLQQDIGELLGMPADGRISRMIVAPHAGYLYSGAVAGKTYREVIIPQTVIVLGPNHTGLGPRESIWSEGAWRVPTGDVPIDEPFAGALLSLAGERSIPLKPDQLAHLHEHSIEVHLPFLHAMRPDVKTVPICLAHLRFAECEALGGILAEEIAERRALGTDVLLVASTDMSHYIPAETARHLDHLALDRIMALDPEGLLEVVSRNGISMCGVVPTTVALVAALKLGATHASVVAYGNSGDISGNLDRVVGYAGVTVA